MGRGQVATLVKPCEISANTGKEWGGGGLGGNCFDITERGWQFSTRLFWGITHLDPQAKQRKFSEIQPRVKIISMGCLFAAFQRHSAKTRSLDSSCFQHSKLQLRLMQGDLGLFALFWRTRYPPPTKKTQDGRAVFLQASNGFPPGFPLRPQKGGVITAKKRVTDRQGALPVGLGSGRIFPRSAGPAGRVSAARARGRRPRLRGSNFHLRVAAKFYGHGLFKTHSVPPVNIPNH